MTTDDAQPNRDVLAEPGDVIEVHAHRLGEHPRLGEILEVLESQGRVHYRVRWEDDRETVFYPGEDAVVRRARARRGAAT